VVAARARDAGSAGHEVRAHRPDGKPEPAGARWVSASEAGPLRLVASGPERVACDLELVASRPVASWRYLLGASAELAPRLAEALGEPLDLAATRVWCALECCAKLGTRDAPLLLRSAAGDAVCLGTGDIEIAIVAISVDGLGELVAAVATAPHPDLASASGLAAS